MPPPVKLRLLKGHDCQVFVEAVARSVALHSPWVAPPATASEFEKYLAPTGQECFKYGIWSNDEQLAGVVNVNAIIRGAFQNGSLGFYAFEGFQRRGYLSLGLTRCIELAFREHGLHRLEANIQPGNDASLRLISRLGFRSEGVAKRLLNVRGVWRDHERFALTVDEWIVTPNNCPSASR